MVVIAVSLEHHGCSYPYPLKSGKPMLKRLVVLIIFTLILALGYSALPVEDGSPPKKVSTTTRVEQPFPEATPNTTVALEVPVTTTHTHPVTKVPPVPAGEELRVPESIRTLIRVHFDEFGPGVSDWFTTIVWRESNGRPDAWNRESGCYGLSQIALPLHWRRFALYGWDWKTSWMDPDKNLTVAADLYREQGRKPWTL